MPAKPIFVGGTSSHAGKSWMTTAICLHLKQRGFRVAPFKAQNMSNNSYPCRAGGEIGRAQVAQAEACGLEPEPDFNPILLKPSTDMGSQVVVNGKVWQNLQARAYYEHFDWLLSQVLAAYERLAARFDYIVIEGAGSVAELNLKSRDLVNFGLATRLNAPSLLVADIDRGGVFAALAGTLWLLDPEEARLVRAFAVNRFRGDPALFTDGVRILEEKTQRPCLGVFPYAHDIRIDDEDAVSIEEARAHNGFPLRVAILHLPRISNFTDFRLLHGARWITEPVDEPFDVVILPGTKSTLGDLDWLRAQGLDAWIERQHTRGARIIGVCGGYQMLGRKIEDPEGVESHGGWAEGLGLLPVTTVMEREKITRVVDADTPGGHRFRGYEIHMGRTEVSGAAVPFAVVEGRAEGCRIGRVTGTYLHGALEDAAVLSELLGLSIPEPPPKEQEYDKLAAWFAANANQQRFEELFL